MPFWIAFVPALTVVSHEPQANRTAPSKQQYNNHSHLQRIKLNLFFSVLVLKQRYTAQDCPHFKSINGIAPSRSFNTCASLGVFFKGPVLCSHFAPPKGPPGCHNGRFSLPTAERCRTAHGIRRHQTALNGRHGPELSGFILWKSWKSTDQGSNLGPWATIRMQKSTQII